MTRLESAMEACPCDLINVGIVDRIDEWVTADANWFKDNRTVLEIAFDIFLAEGEWPQVGTLRRLLHQRGIRGVDVQTIANSKPPIPAYSTMAIQDRVFLGVRHLLQLPKADPLLRLLVDATNEGVLAYSGTDEQPAVHYDNPRFFKYDSETLIRLVPLISSDYPNPFGGGNYGEEWVLFVNDALILEFEEVTGPVDYLRRQLAIIRKWVERLSPSPQEPSENGGADSAGYLTDQVIREHLEPVLATLRGQLEDDDTLEPEDKANIQADLDSAEFQLRAAAPNRAVIGAALERIKKTWPLVAQLTTVAAAIVVIIHGL